MSFQAGELWSDTFHCTDTSGSAFTGFAFHFKTDKLMNQVIIRAATCKHEHARLFVLVSDRASSAPVVSRDTPGVSPLKLETLINVMWHYHINTLSVALYTEITHRLLVMCRLEAHASFTVGNAAMTAAEVTVVT